MCYRITFTSIIPPEWLHLLIHLDQYWRTHLGLFVNINYIDNYRHISYFLSIITYQRTYDVTLRVFPQWCVHCLRMQLSSCVSRTVTWNERIQWSSWLKCLPSLQETCIWVPIWFQFFSVKLYRCWEKKIYFLFLINNNLWENLWCHTEGVPSTICPLCKDAT